MWKKSYFSDWFSPVTQDGQAMLWDLNEGKHLYTLDGGDMISECPVLQSQLLLALASTSGTWRAKSFWMN